MSITETKNQVAPYICGTIVGGSPFTRKLKMLRMDLFALLSCVQSANLSADWKQAKTLKRGVAQLVEDPVDQKPIFPAVDACLENWEGIIQDKCFRNEITDVDSINVPDLKSTTGHSSSGKGKNCEVFAFAAFLPPGVHQFLIYCPKTDRVFCKEVVVDLNSKDYFPELPKTPAIRKRKTMANVWRKWKPDTPENQLMAFNQDSSMSESLASGTPTFLGGEDGEEEFAKSSQILIENYEYIKQLFLELVGKSSTYPKIEGYQFSDYIVA
jgi:hypothetical protein